MKAQWWMWGVLCVPVLAGAAPPVAAVYECLIEPAQVVELRTTVEGLIDKVNVRRGDSVRRGQVLAELQSRAEKLAVASAKFRAGMEGQIDTSQSRIAYATKKLARAEELHRQNMVSAQSRDDADAELRLANAELKAAMENRDLARIEQQRAEDQLAMRTLVNPGDLAESGSGRKAVLKLAQIDPLRVDIILPGALFGKIRAGARVVVLPQGDAVRHSATVSMVDKVVDAASGTLVARVDLPNRDGKIPSGVRCRAEFDAGLLGLGAVDAR
jgi:RND family efflux transporter MFP subunit